MDNSLLQTGILLALPAEPDRPIAAGEIFKRLGVARPTPSQRASLSRSPARLWNRGLVNRYVTRHMKYKVTAMMSLLYSFVTPTISHAMEFRIFHQAELNEDAIIGEGPIIRGDAEKFRSFLNKGSRDKFGNIIFVLNSPGGDVDEAFRIVAVMDKIKVTTIIPENAMCSSTCASILYIVRRQACSFGVWDYRLPYMLRDRYKRTNRVHTRRTV